MRTRIGATASGPVTCRRDPEARWKKAWVENQGENVMLQKYDMTDKLTEGTP